MPRKKILINENKRERFLRLASHRTQDVLNRLRVLGNCANRSVYEYTQDDIEKIFSALKDQFKSVEAKFHFPKHKEFKL
jgi:bifunctional pyridoxal-dependent enzyme with beta-cystathionase and maltose regulon repressor activities